jgi:peptidoglycan/LPS O-acetylase OafA/YrhL
MDTTKHERRTWMPAYALTIGVVTTLLLAVRLFSRVTRAGGRWGVDDVFITIAWAVATASVGVLVKRTCRRNFLSRDLLTQP